MLADPVLSDARDAEARRGPALWEGRASRGPIVARLVPILVIVGMFAAMLLIFALDGRPKYVRVRGMSGWEQQPLDPAAAMILPIAMVFVAAVIVFTVVMAGTRAARQSYRIDGLTAQITADGVIEDIAISNIHRVSAHFDLGWYRVRIIGASRQRIDMLLGAGEAARALATLRALGVKCATLDVEVVPPVHNRLFPGEPVRWRGRPGLATFDAIRAIVAVGIVLPFAVFLGVFAWLWSSRPDPFLGLLLTGGILALFGWPSMAILLSFGGRLFVWLRDALGSVVVTDRRIAWAAPFTGRFYRERMLSDLADVVVVEQRGHRAWLALTIQDDEDVRIEDLRGIARIDHFLMALGFGA